MNQPFFLEEDYFLILQWIAIIIPLLFIGAVYIIEGNYDADEDDPVFGYVFFSIIIICNILIGYSVYEDCLFFYDLFIGESGEKYNNKSLLFFLNFSPVIGGARLFAIGSLMVYYAAMSDAKENYFWKSLTTILFIVNFITLLPAIILALF